jgi:hypothetical protein
MSNFLIDEDTDLLAAEFVLGTLDSQERANAQALLRGDHGFIAMVRIWERRFGELHLMVEPVEPDAEIFQRIRAKIIKLAPSEPAPVDLKPAVATPTPDGKPPAVATPTSDGKPSAVATPTPDSKPPAAAVPTPDGKPLAVATLTSDGKPSTVATRAPEGKPPAVATPDSKATPPAVGKVATPPDEPLAPTGVLGGEVTGPMDAATDREVPKPQDVAPLNGVTPTQTAATGDAEKPAQAPAALDSTNGGAAGAPPGPEPQPPERAVIPEGGTPAKVAIPAPPPPPRVPGKPWREDRRPDQRQESTLEVVRSRGRWRAFGVFMMGLVVGIVAVLTAWRFVPDLLPAELRPAELMMSLGIEPTRSGPMIKPAPPESQFDE